MIPCMNEWREWYDWVLFTQDISPEIIRKHLLDEAIRKSRIGYATLSAATLKRERRAKKRVQTRYTQPRTPPPKYVPGADLLKGLRFMWGGPKLQDVMRFLAKVPESSVDRLQCIRC